MPDQPVVAKASDLSNHVRSDYRTVHGIWPQVKAALALATDLFMDNTSDDASGLYIQIGRGLSTAAAGTAVSFDVAFSVTPSVVVSGQGWRCVGVYSISTTGFSARAADFVDWQTATVQWIAIGKK
jgi:hypothetical protein